MTPTLVFWDDAKLVGVLRANGARRILIAGPPGTGKTALAATIAIMLDIPVRRTAGLIRTHSVVYPDGPPYGVEVAAQQAGRPRIEAWDSALLRAVRDWMRAPGPWIIEGVHSLRAWASASH